jgi:hypothetical protein
VFVLSFIEILFVTVLSSGGDANAIFITGLKFTLYKTDEYVDHVWFLMLHKKILVVANSRFRIYR